MRVQRIRVNIYHSKNCDHMKILIPLIFFIVIIPFFSCNKVCDETPSSKVAGFSIDFFDVPTNNYLYPKYPPLIPGYNKDSLVIVDDIGRFFKLRQIQNQHPDNPIYKYYRINLGPIYYEQTDQNSFTQEITRKFYIRYNQKERDTLVCVFKNKRTKCHEEFEFIKFYYRGELVSQTNNDFGIRPVKLNKP